MLFFVQEMSLFGPLAASGGRRLSGSEIAPMQMVASVYFDNTSERLRLAQILCVGGGSPPPKGWPTALGLFSFLFFGWQTPTATSVAFGGLKAQSFCASGGTARITTKRRRKFLSKGKFCRGFKWQVQSGLLKACMRIFDCVKCVKALVASARKTHHESWSGVPSAKQRFSLPQKLVEPYMLLLQPARQLLLQSAGFETQSGGSRADGGGVDRKDSGVDEVDDSASVATRKRREDLFLAGNKKLQKAIQLAEEIQSEIEAQKLQPMVRLCGGF